MGVLDTISKGALSQFGREFGRAAANSILNGQNSQKIELTERHTGRIKPSDTPVIRAIKNIQNLDFVIQEKANASRLIEITDEFIAVNKFTGIDTLINFNDFLTLASIYNNKYKHGRALIADDYKDKVIDFLELKRKELEESMNEFNNNLKEFISEQQSIYNQNKKFKNKLLVWAFPIWGLFGLHHFYLGKPGKAIFHVLCCWTLILPVINLFEFISILTMNNEQFQIKYNPEINFLNQFNFSQ